MEILIIGAGSWGTTLSFILAQKGYKTVIWSKEDEVVKDINNNKKNQKYTDGLILPGNIRAVGYEDLGNLKAGENIDFKLVIFAVPSEYLRQVSTNFKDFLEDHSSNLKAVVNAAKGIELKTKLRMSQVLLEVLPESLKDKIAVLSGPNISSEIMNKLPSVSTIASENKTIASYLQPILSTEFFRVYTNEDMTGVEICGAYKNIIAIAAGISDGLGFAANTKASLITRGLNELKKFGLCYGSKESTFYGASGLGDLITTCISPKSRNRTVGERIAKGEKLKDIIGSMSMVAEGVKTSKAVYEMSAELNIELPITESVYRVLFKNADPMKSVKNLMTRKFKSED
jgi:glycerol-3-phosphate dehydrogenase (NAD(P)+)